MNITSQEQITTEVIKAFLEGHDPQERIVNLEYNYQEDFIKVYYRNENDQKCISHQPFIPFLWATHSACLRLCEGDRNALKSLMSKYGIGVKALSIKNLQGKEIETIKNGYTFMFFAKKQMSYSRFLSFFKEAKNPVYSKKVEDKNNPSSSQSSKQYLCVTPQEQFLISTGKRFFKGYDDYDQVLRMIFDLETSGLDPKTCRIEQIGIRFNRPTRGEKEIFEKIITVEGVTEEEKNDNELMAIFNFLQIIYTYSPDIITAHNGENFDWNFIIGRCDVLGVPLSELSKRFFDGRPIYKEERESILKLGGEIEKFNKTIVPKTIITDSLHAVRRAQAIDSNMLRADLKYVTQYSKLKKDNRVYVPGDLISKIWNDNEKNYAFNNENGDWYIYNPDYMPPKSNNEPVLEYDIEYFRELIERVNNKIPSRDEWVEINAEGESISWEEYVSDIESEKYPSNITPQQLYDDYVFQKKNEYVKNTIEKRDNFILVTRNEILNGYTLETGKYIVERYLLDDLWECDRVEHRYNNNNFLIDKIMPIPFAKATTMGTAGQWKSIMMAWSYENNLAIPPFRENHSFTGGLSRLLKTGYVSNVAKFDYNSLYPSIILTWGISDELDLMGSMLYFLEYVLAQRELYKNLMKKCNKEVDKLSKELENIIDEKEKNKILKKIEKLQAEAKSNDKKQLPLKLLGNSFFGSYGCPSVFNWGSLSCAERTTCTGRMGLRLMISYFNKLGYKPIVGDSFSGDTPLFIKYKNNNWIDIKPISEIINENKIKIDELGREYDYSEKPYWVLCRSGWHDVEYVYRHICDKDIYRVSDENGYVDVTEDHSLFNDKQEKIKPSEINENTKLEYYNGIIDNDDAKNLILLNNGTEFKYWGKIVAKREGNCNKIPSFVYNFGVEGMKEFYNSFMEHQDNNITYSKTILAGLLYIRKKIKQ